MKIFALIVILSLYKRLFFHPSTLFIFLFSLFHNLRFVLFTYIFSLLRKEGGFLLTWLPQFSCFTSLSVFSSHFSLNSPSLTVSILLSISPSFSSSAVTAFLYLFLPHALLHYNSLALFASIHARSVFPHFCLKAHPLSRLCISCSFPLPLVRPCIDSAHFCFAFRVFLRLSLTFSVHPFPSAVSLFRLPVLHLRLRVL